VTEFLEHAPKDCSAAEIHHPQRLVLGSFSLFNQDVFVYVTSVICLKIQNNIILIIEQFRKTEYLNIRLIQYNKQLSVVKNVQF